MFSNWIYRGIPTIVLLAIAGMIQLLAIGAFVQQLPHACVAGKSQRKFPQLSIGDLIDLIREISGDVTGAAAVLAGLSLVFLGSIATAYDGYGPEHQHAVGREYRIRIWFAFAGLLVAMVSTGLSLAGQLFARPETVARAVLLLALALLATGVAALITALGLKQ